MTGIAADLRAFYNRWWKQLGLFLLGTVPALILVLALAANQGSGVKGVVRCADLVNNCRVTSATAVVYVTLERTAFNPWSPPAAPYKELVTDQSGNFTVALPPGTYWFAAEKHGNPAFASSDFVEVTVQADRTTNVTLELDLHLPQ